MYFMLKTHSKNYISNLALNPHVPALIQLQLLQEWLATNKLTLNLKKSNFVIFHNYQKKLPRDISLEMFDSCSNN